METEVLELERLLPGAFKRYGSHSKKAGQIMYTDAGAPRRNPKLIKSPLESIAKTSSEPLRPARIKDGSCTDAVAILVAASGHGSIHSSVRQIQPAVPISPVLQAVEPVRDLSPLPTVGVYRPDQLQRPQTAAIPAGFTISGNDCSSTWLLAPAY